MLYSKSLFCTYGTGIVGVHTIYPYFVPDGTEKLNPDYIQT